MEHINSEFLSIVANYLYEEESKIVDYITSELKDRDYHTKHKETIVLEDKTIVIGNGRLHSFNDQPAIIGTNGVSEYYKDGMLHRDGDNPAFVHTSGYQVYFTNGMVHRDGDKPAMIFPNGDLRYFKNGKMCVPSNL
jgi:hypothetical protein